MIVIDPERTDDRNVRDVWEWAFDIRRHQNGDGWSTRIAVVDPAARHSTGVLSNRGPFLAVVVTTHVDSLGVIGEPEVDMDVLETETFLTLDEVDAILRQREDPLFPPLDDARGLALQLQTSRRLGLYLGPNRGRQPKPSSGSQFHSDDIRRELAHLANHALARYAKKKHVTPFIYLRPVSQGETDGSSLDETASRGNAEFQFAPYARVTPTIQGSDGRQNAASLVSYLMNNLALNGVDASVQWPRELLDRASAVAHDDGAAPIGRFVETAELLGEPPQWLATLVRDRLGRDVPGRVTLLHSLLVNARTARPEWAALRQAGLDACVRSPQLIDEILKYCQFMGTAQEPRFIDHRWATDSIDGQPSTLWRSILEVRFPSVAITSLGYGANREDARRAAVLRFLAPAGRLPLPSVAPFPLHAALLCLIESRGDLVGGISDDGMRFVATHLGDGIRPPESLLLELSRRVADHRLSPDVVAAILVAVPESIDRAPGGWHRLVNAIVDATRNIRHPEYALDVLNAVLTRGAWWMEAGSAVPMVTNHPRTVSSASPGELNDASARVLLRAICANLVQRMQPPRIRGTQLD